MCGIIGTSSISVSNEVFQAGLDEIKHRGPDNQSIKKNDCVIFGHTRLSILDLDIRSNQPFEYQHKQRTIFATFNGEIYNFLSIKEELIQKGYIFHTQSDTELLCAAYCEYGTECFDRFEGMWAVGINEGNDLILSRDRRGKKPLYYTNTNGVVSFGSSLRSVSIISGQDKIDSKGVELYFALGFIPTSYSIYKDILKVEPGDIFHFEKKDDQFYLKEKRKSLFLLNQKTNQLSVKALIHDAVEKRLMSDVPVTTLMSGGVDSTIVTKLINEIIPGTEAYFVDFDDKKLSEKKWAAYLANRNDIKLNTLFLKPDDLKPAFQNYYSVFEEPFADYSGIPSIAIFKEVSRKYKVVLTGDGGDELFFGYPHYFKKYVLYTFFGLLKPFRNFKFVPYNIKTVLKGSKMEFESNYLKNHAVLTPFATSFINSHFNETISQSKSFLRAIIEYDRQFYNWPEKYLVKVDRSSMFSGIEVRSPFMDENLSHTVNKKPLLFLFTPYNSKLFLKISYFKVFGLKYLMATKKGFTPPINELRNENFTLQEFKVTKKFIEVNSPKLFVEIENMDFKMLERDKILFDRFFFFHEWIKKNNKFQ